MTATIEVKRSVQRELFEHAGRWVAITRDRIVAVGDSPDEVRATARSEGVDRPIVYRVPLPDEATHSYF